MKKHETKVIKNKKKPNEIAVVEKVIDTKKTDRQIDNLPTWEAIQAVESRVSELETSIDTVVTKTKSGFDYHKEAIGKIITKVNKICTRMGLTKL